MSGAACSRCGEGINRPGFRCKYCLKCSTELERERRARRPPGKPRGRVRTELLPKYTKGGMCLTCHDLAHRRPKAGCPSCRQPFGLDVIERPE